MLADGNVKNIFMEYLSKDFMEMVFCKEGHNLLQHWINQGDGKTKLNPCLKMQTYFEKN